MGTGDPLLVRRADGESTPHEALFFTRLSQLGRSGLKTLVASGHGRLIRLTLATAFDLHLEPCSRCSCSSGVCAIYQMFRFTVAFDAG